MLSSTHSYKPGLKIKALQNSLLNGFQYGYEYFMNYHMPQTLKSCGIISKQFQCLGPLLFSSVFHETSHKVAIFLSAKQSLYKLESYTKFIVSNPFHK